MITYITTIRGVDYMKKSFERKLLILEKKKIKILLNTTQI